MFISFSVLINLDTGCLQISLNSSSAQAGLKQNFRWQIQSLG